MTKFILIAIPLFWITSLAILIIALTAIYPETILKKYRPIIVFGFIVINRLLMPVFKTAINKSKAG